METSRSTKLKAVALTMKVVLALREKNKFEPDSDNCYIEEEVIKAIEGVLIDELPKVIGKYTEELELLLDNAKQRIINLEKRA